MIEHLKFQCQIKQRLAVSVSYEKSRSTLFRSSLSFEARTLIVDRMLSLFGMKQGSNKQYTSPVCTKLWTPVIIKAWYPRVQRYSQVMALINLKRSRSRTCSGLGTHRFVNPEYSALNTASAVDSFARNINHVQGKPLLPPGVGELDICKHRHINCAIGFIGAKSCSETLGDRHQPK